MRNPLRNVRYQGVPTAACFPNSYPPHRKGIFYIRRKSLSTRFNDSLRTTRNFPKFLHPQNLLSSSVVTVVLFSLSLSLFLNNQRVKEKVCNECNEDIDNFVKKLQVQVINYSYEVVIYVHFANLILLHQLYSATLLQFG